jgi:sulfatase maturation enzyme AslB (radical SAM superfamily)
MDSKCAAFWHHTNIRSDNRIFPCCRFKEPVATFHGTVDNILLLPEYVQLRKQSSEGEYISSCQKCYKEESQGKQSLRQVFNKEYNTDTVSLEYLEIGFDNICNLTCDGCWEEFSSEWGKKLMVVKSKIVKSTAEFTQISDTISKVLFLGGEPLMTTRHQKFLESFNDLSKLTVIYNTNGTFLLDDKTINILNQCKSAEFIVSIDGYADLNSRVRPGSNWKDILLLIDQIKSLQFKLSVHSVIHLNNWKGLKELSKFVKSLDVNWTVNVLTYPHRLDIINIENKQEFISLIESIDVPTKEYIIAHVKI